MKKIVKSFSLLLSVLMVLGLCGCGEKAIPEYNTAVEGREVDKTDPTSVIENAVLSDMKEIISSSEYTAAAYKEIASEQKGKKTTYYILASVGGYVYENGKLNRSFGKWPFPAIVTLREKGGNYEVIGFVAGKTFETDEERDNFVIENFPEGTDPKGIYSGVNDELLSAEKKRIAELYGISESEFATGEEMIELIPITNEAYYAVSDYFVEYPDWLGDMSRVEDGKRYTYTTSYEGEDGGKGILSFIKTDEDGNEVKRDDIFVDGDYVEFPEDAEPPQPEGESYEEIPEEIIEPDDEGEGTTERTPEEIEDIMKEYDYDDGLEYTLVD